MAGTNFIILTNVTVPDGERLKTVWDPDTNTHELVVNGIASLVGFFNGLPIDESENTPVTLSHQHHQVHEGETHKAEDLQLSLGSSTVQYSITVPVFSPTIDGPHMIVGGDIYNGAALIQIYEDATFAGGNIVNSYNRNRNSPHIPGTLIRSGVTSNDGTLIDSFFAGYGIRMAGSNRQQSEWILKSNTIYRVDVIGQAAGTKAVVDFDWYEEVPN